jgi:hypothetical protein
VSDKLCPATFFKAHKFEARYDEHPIAGRIRVEEVTNMREFRDLMVTRTYVRDVCVYCGQTVERVK